MKHVIAVMQPYFLPYIGYWQLIKKVDEFVIYDNIEFTKKGWFNRNRFLVNGEDALFTVAIKSDSDSLSVSERYLAESFDREKLLRRFESSYRKTPYFKQHFPVIQNIVRFPSNNLFLYLLNSIREICAFLEIKTQITIASQVPLDHEAFKGQAKIIEICRQLKATAYINPIGGLDLYRAEDFQKNNIRLGFLKAQPVPYAQFDHEFVSFLSILDLMMFNSRDQMINLLEAYEQIEPKI